MEIDAGRYWGWAVWPSWGQVLVLDD